MDKLKTLITLGSRARGCVVLSATVLLTLCLNGMIAAPAVHYFAYLYSTYALAVVCAWFPGAMGRLKKRCIGALERCAAARPGVKRLCAMVGDPERRMRSLLGPTLAFNLGYAVFKLVAGIWVGSWWMIAAGIYYAVLAGLRYSLLRTFFARGSHAGEERDWTAYRNTAVRMLFLTVAMNGVIIQTVRLGRAYRYPGALIYAFALYAFVKIIVAATALIRKRREENVMLAASRCISFACGLMSMLALQTALIDRFGDEEAFARTANALFGAFMCVAMLCVCGHMLYRYRRHAQEVREEGHA